MTKSKNPSNDDIVVFSILRASTCAECGSELVKGELLRVESERALCLPCADLDRLVFLERGDAALTRRAKKYSALHVVVVRFSRARKRYERQGILVQESALERAERECLADSDARAAARQRSAHRRAELDLQFVGEFARRILERYAGCPPGEDVTIAEHACRKYSGRIGRTAGAKQFDPTAIDLAVAAHIRHTRTGYELLLSQGHSREAARAHVSQQVTDTIGGWRNAGAQ